MVLHERVHYQAPPRTRLRRAAAALSASRPYRYAVLLLLGTNLVVLALHHYGAPLHFALTLNHLHHGLSCALALACLLNLANRHVYRHNGKLWRAVEVTLTALALLDLALDLRYDWFRQYLGARNYGPHFVALRLFFIVRDLRVMLVLQCFSGIQRLIEIILLSVRQVGKLLVAYVLTLMVYAYLGCHLFGTVTHGEMIDD